MGARVGAKWAQEDVREIMRAPTALLHLKAATSESRYI
jgi:hypothetical protein